MPIGGEKNDQSYRDQSDERVGAHNREIEREHAALLSGEANPLPEIVLVRRARSISFAG
jgi:hypothetical protein